MGYSVLYIAFGIVALWLLSEVLLQHKARLRWRVLAFAGFLGVVAGVYQRSVPLILAGAVGFGAGQTCVTLSYRRGFAAGWAIGGRFGVDLRRRAGAKPPAPPALAVSQVEPEPDGFETVPAPVGPAADEVASAGVRGIYRPVPMLDDSGEFPLYDGQSTYTPDPYTSGGYEGYGAQGYGWSGGYGQGAEQPAAAAPQHGQQSAWERQGYGGYPQQEAAAGYDATGAPDGYGTSYGYGYGGEAGQGQDGGGWQQEQHGQAYGGQQEPHGQGYGGQQDQSGQAYGGQQADPYAAPYGYPQQQYGRQEQQPYIPQQPQQSPYEQTPAGERSEYADPYDPYRY
ncbi:hypothetical protein [Actinacidiphila yeochonensis]|uniref:hypothetical protein n=1 Tax=Actinacidiphila yeochonensis TaxID=89050 RepID=UPI00056332A3|nr:hypothetical protein [Actinacidiphila yeochonensis]